ncbi:hypothetical protein [Leptolyngbya sp. AN02str]
MQAVHAVKGRSRLSFLDGCDRPFRAVGSTGLSAKTLTGKLHHSR